STPCSQEFLHFVKGYLKKFAATRIQNLYRWDARSRSKKENGAKIRSIRVQIVEISRFSILIKNTGKNSLLPESKIYIDRTIDQDLRKRTAQKSDRSVFK